MTWTILRTAPCAEFKARDGLHCRGLPAVVPVEFQTTSYGRGRENIRKAPVIRGYVFADVALDQWATVHAVREVKGAIMIGDRPATLTPHEVSAIELLSRPLDRHRGVRWRPGDVVAIRRGAFAALEGVVKRIERGRVIAELSMFGKAMQVPIDADQLEAA